MKRSPEDTQKIIFSMADCFVSGRKAIYCSSELTTGVRLYTAILNNGCTDRHQLRDKMGTEWLRDNVFVHNETAANTFAASVQERQKHTTISPACLFVPEWGQHDYLSFWESLIKTRICEVWFNENWQYSNGCTFEYMAATAAGIPTLDKDGGPLEAVEARDLIQRAIAELDTKGIDTSKLREHRSGITSAVRPSR
jgi:hypothetical protein